MGDLVLTNARLLEGLGGVTGRATLRLAEGREAEVGRGADVETRPGKAVIDLAGQTSVPTLSTFHDVSEDHAEKYPCALVEQAGSQREEAYLTLGAAREAGVRVAMGFDSYPLGRNARELVRMVEGGLTPMGATTPPRTPPLPSVWRTWARSVPAHSPTPTPIPRSSWNAYTWSCRRASPSGAPVATTISGRS